MYVGKSDYSVFFCWENRLSGEWSSVGKLIRKQDFVIDKKTRKYTDMLHSKTFVRRLC